MNSFSSDQMLLPSISQLLDPDGKCVFSGSLHQSTGGDDELMFSSGIRHECAKTSPKLLTPPDSPVFSELTTPTYLLGMAANDGAQTVPNLDTSGLLHTGFFHTSFLQSLETLETLDLESPQARDIMNGTLAKADMFDDADSGTEWPGIYIEDIDDSGVPSPTPSPPFELPDLAAFNNVLLYPDQTRTDRRKHNSMSTDESLHSDSGSELGSCPSPTTTSRSFLSHHVPSKAKSGGRTHNYRRHTITKSLTDLKDGTKTSGSSSSSTAERRKRGRPRKRATGEMASDREGGISRRRNGRKAVKGSHLWEFILNLLKQEDYCPQYIKWEDKESGVFRIVNSKVVANMWGEIKNNPRMTYEKLSRAMRYYYKRQILERVDKARLVYKFGEKAEGWRETADE